MKRQISEFLPDVKDLYYIYDDGRVYSSYRGGRFLRGIDRVGYSKVALYKKDRNRIDIGIHRLVALAFIENPENKPMVNHKDGNKKNNTVDNLEWCNSSENQLHAIEHNLRKGWSGENNFSAKITTKDVKEIWKLHFRRVPVSKIANKIKCSDKIVRNVLSGRTWSKVTFND